MFFSGTIWFYYEVYFQILMPSNFGCAGLPGLPKFQGTLIRSKVIPQPNAELP